MARCPVPACENELSGATSAFCSTHHFMVPAKTVREIIALKFACSRTDSDAERAHLREQIDAHVRIAVRQITGGRNAA